MTGGEILLECLLQEGVKHVFGIPGAQLNPILDAIFRIGSARGMSFITTRHEQAAAHMADAYYRITSRPAVCLGTVGPGGADLIPGVYPAFADSIPLIAITAQNQTWRSYPDHGSMQALDQYMLFKPVTKWNAVVSHTSRIPELVQRAFRVALSGKPGPVHLDFPADVLFGEADFPDRLPEPKTYRPTVPPQGDRGSVRKAAKMLVSANLPLIHAGRGVLAANASKEVVSLARHLSAPVVTSLGARGVIAEDDPLCLIPGSPGAVAAQSMADVVLHVGGKLGDTDFWGRSPPWGEPEAQRWIQVDIDPEMIAYNRAVELAIIGDAKAVLRQLLSEVERLTPKIERDISGYRELTDEWEKEFVNLALGEETTVHPLRVVYEARRFFPRNAITVVDGGNTAVWAYYLNRVYEPNTFLWAGDSGHLGTGLPYAIAAKLAKPERQVYLLSGDGAFMLNVQELETAARLRCNIIAIIFNDRQWGMIKGAQKLQFGARYIGVDFNDVRYDLVAEAMGCYGERVSRPDEIRPALERALKSGKPAVVDVIIDGEANLTPPDLTTLASIWLEGCEPPRREYAVAELVAH